MAELISISGVPVSEKILRDASKHVANVMPNFAEQKPDLGVKKLHAIIGPILDTADSADLSISHRAAAYNTLCAVIEKCQASDVQYAREALLEDFIWARLFNIYLTRSDDAKGKSMRQVLLVLTSVLLKNENGRWLELRDRAVTAFVEIICQRQDRVRVKPALQGLAHFIQKGITSNTHLIDAYAKLLGLSTDVAARTPNTQSLFSTFLSWIVHHDTALSAGHLIKNFLIQLRQSDRLSDSNNADNGLPMWIQPVVETLRLWPDRIQEFKSHVFPHCFVPTFDEYLRFLSYLHFERHVGFTGFIPPQLRTIEELVYSWEDLNEFRLLLAAIETGKELGIVKVLDYRVGSTIDIRHDAIYLPDDVFNGWLSHPELEVRLAGLYLSTHTSAATRPITGGVITSFKRNMVHLHADTDANFRRELLSYIGKLFNRFRGSTATLAKHSHRPVSANQNRLPFPKQNFTMTGPSHKPLTQDPLSESLGFIGWYLEFLRWELRSEASYQRRITAVRALAVVLKSGLDPRVPYHLLSKGAQGELHWVHGLRIPNNVLIRSLLDLTLDPFDDIRDASISALQLCLESLPSEEKELVLAKLPGFIGRAEVAMLRTGRADQADGVARVYSLLFSSNTQTPSTHLQHPSSKIKVLGQLNQQLKDTLAVAHRDLSEAVNGRPVHGTFAAVRYVIDHPQFYSDLGCLSVDDFAQWKTIHNDLLDSLKLLWACVTEPLCADAPEGHVPEELEEDASLDTKEVLSYSWRGLKEASILLRVIITKAPIGTSSHTLLASNSVEEFGNLCFTQLVELRHRGAFSTVAQTFAAFCRRCISADDPLLRALPGRWYEETLSTIQAKADTITRRSGGLPALMAGIVAAEAQPGGKLFSRAMKDLVDEASVDAQSSNIEESRLPQVHALNCIKEFFMSSRLSVASEAYVGEGLELAARTLNSEIWPIRNCSLMLFKALIERLLGSDEAQDWKEREGIRTSRFSYNSYPSLIGILQGLLDPEGRLKESLNTPKSNSPMDLHGAEGVFPALQILRQASPPEIVRRDILKSVMKLFRSPHWHLRDMAARTATSLHRPNEYPLQMKSLLNCSETSTNAQHGSLLCSRYMLSRTLQDVKKLDHHVLVSIMASIQEAATKHMSQSCPFVNVLILDLISLCGIAVIKLPIFEPLYEAWKKLTAAVSIGPEHDLAPRSAADNALFQQSLAKVFFIDRAILRPDHLDTIVSEGYQNIGDALLMLGKNDADTCCAVLETLNDIIQLRSPKGPLLQVSLILLHILRLVRGATDHEVLSKAQSVLADGLSRDDMSKNMLSLTSEDDLLLMIDKLEAQCLQSTPSSKRSALHLLGYFLDWIFQQFPAHRPSMFDKIARYIRLLRMTMIDTNPFDDRFAAVQSVSALSHVWKLDSMSRKSESLLLGLAFVLYDMLNDDDDEIRDIASVATSRLIQAHSLNLAFSASKPLVPVLASHRLAKFLIRTFATSPFLYKEAIRRLTGTPSRALLFSTPFADVFAQTREEDTALFATENQNLYKDDTLDAALWTRVLSSLPANTVPESLRSCLISWVIEGLEVLTNTAQAETDGALGWTAKSEVFTLGMRVFCAADVLLTWFPMAAGASKIRSMLKEFSHVGKASEVHGLWIQKAEKAVESSIIRLLKEVDGNLTEIQRALRV
ncbi:HEAT repeat protein-like protein [Byssothecium circinans]|uniref:HEAT repeat protein-like protein n=1 Tax=Byssothecium circinans TaxID=147558 RepID=A0A6A5UAF2_9PLEO|nr:HEAT repeat protein-like protein [Byssothecium circinans]